VDSTTAGTGAGTDPGAVIDELPVLKRIQSNKPGGPITVVETMLVIKSLRSSFFVTSSSCTCSIVILYFFNPALAALAEVIEAGQVHQDEGESSEEKEEEEGATVTESSSSFLPQELQR